MKKAFSNSSPSKLVRRVLSRTSNLSKISDEGNKNTEDSTENMGHCKPSVDLELEIVQLKKQLGILQGSVRSMQIETERKEKALATLAREKEKLASDLKREKRSSTSLKQQLDDERAYYFKEKEQYCQEMNDCKKLKQKIIENKESTSELCKLDSNEVLQYKNENSKLREALNQTLEANYNLSIKFLRMKNTKCNLKSRLKTLEHDHKKAMSELENRMETIKNELINIEDNIGIPLTPSSKKYLQIVKQNGTLMHENLCLQSEVDRISIDLEHYKAHKLRFDTNSKLKLINSKSKQKLPNLNTKDEVSNKHEKSKSKLKKKNKESCTTNKHTNTSASYHKKDQENMSKAIDGEIKKLFERREKDGTPNITILPSAQQNYTELKKPLQNKRQSGGNSNGTDSDVFHSLQTTGCRSQIQTDISEDPSQTRTDDSNYPSQIRTDISDNPSQIRTEISGYSQYTPSCVAIRTQSAPEIVQTSTFIRDNKTSNRISINIP